jgi:hypothetical protein
VIRLRDPQQLANPADAPFVEAAFDGLAELAGSSDPEIADAAISRILEHLLAGHIVVDPPLPTEDQRKLRDLIEVALSRKRH